MYFLTLKTLSENENLHIHQTKMKSHLVPPGMLPGTLKECEHTWLGISDLSGFINKAKLFSLAKSLFLHLIITSFFDFKR